LLLVLLGGCGRRTVPAHLFILDQQWQLWLLSCSWVYQKN